MKGKEEPRPPQQEKKARGRHTEPCLKGNPSAVSFHFDLGRRPL